jgi:hypothetical protein
MNSPTANALAKKPPSLIGPFIIFILCSSVALLYGVYGFPPEVQQPVCNFLTLLNNHLCDVSGHQQHTGYESELESWTQGIFVAVLTGLAFWAHWVRQSRHHPGATSVIRHPWVCVPLLFGIPTILFFAAMIHHGHQDAAIFVMAIAAIFVAAEHFIALKEQESIAADLANTQRRQQSVTMNLATAMRIQASQMQGQTADLGMITSRVSAQAAAIDAVSKDLREQVGSVRNALGTSYSQRLMYDAYRKKPEQNDATQRRHRLTGIYAVYKHLDIDEVWWDCNVGDIWKNYFLYTEKTLFSSLKEGGRENLTIVTEMPIRWSGENDDLQAMYFSRFIGLMWYCIVLKHAAASLFGGNAHLISKYDIRIASLSNWIHVIDDRVFQILGAPPDNLVVRDLTFDIHISKDSKSAENLAKWAINDIKRASRRGVPASEYICSKFSHGAVMNALGPDQTLTDRAVEDMLDGVGMKKWIDARKFDFPHQHDGDTIRHFCREIFYEFMTCLGCNAADCQPQNFEWELQ